jgi:hypothetical protein
MRFVVHVRTLYANVLLDGERRTSIVHAYMELVTCIINFLMFIGHIPSWCSCQPLRLEGQRSFDFSMI